MSDEVDTEVEIETPANGQPPPGWASAAAYNRFRESRVELKAAKEAAARAAAERDAARAEAAAAKAEAASHATRYTLDLSIVRAGITDAEDIAEIRDRYSRVEPGEDGKRPAPGEWLAKLKESPPRWFRGYMDEPAPKVEAAADPAAAPVVEDPLPPRQQRVAPADPNAGVVAGAQPRGTRIDDAKVSRLSAPEWAGVRGTVAADLARGGEIKISDKMLKRLGG